MTVMRMLATLAFALLAAPAVAQDQDDRALSSAQMTEGFAACLSSKADTPALTDALTKTGWTNAPDSYGTIIFTPPKGDNTLVMRASDAVQCRVESMDLDTDTAATLLAQAFTTAGIMPTPSQDDQGCSLFQIASGVTATLMAGDSDSDCTSKETSAVIFAFPAP